MASQNSTSPNLPSVNVKITIAGTDEHRKVKLALKDLGSSVLPDKVSQAKPHRSLALGCPISLDTVSSLLRLIVTPRVQIDTYTSFGNIFR